MVCLHENERNWFRIDLFSKTASKVISEKTHRKQFGEALAESENADSTILVQMKQKKHIDLFAKPK